MVDRTHPNEIELFEYLENELPQPRRDEIAAHLAVCSVCAEHVELASVGRQALQGVGLLELPESRRDEILRSLPAREREVAPGKRRGFFSKEILIGIAVLLVVAALTAVLVRSGGNSSGSESSAGSAGGAAEATATAGGGGGTTQPVRAADLSASGSPESIAAELQGKGFDAAVQGDRVVVHGATREQVREALADRGAGDVEIVVKNP